MREILLAAIPPHLYLRITLVDVKSQTLHLSRVVVAAHKTDAGEVAIELFHKRIDGIGVQFFTNVSP